MSNVNPFATQVTQTGQTLTGQQGVFAKGLGGGLGNGLAFWSLMLGNAVAEGEEKEGDVTASPLNLIKTKTGEEKEISQKLAAFLAEQGITDEDLAATDETALIKLISTMEFTSEGELSAEQETVLTETLELRVDAISTLVTKLTAGLPQQDGDTNKLIERLVSRLNKSIENLQTRLEFIQDGTIHGEELPLPLLIAMGLSPAELTQIADKISQVEDKLGRDLSVDDIIAGVGGIVPLVQDNNSYKPQTRSSSAAIGFGASGIPATLSPEEQLAQHLNNINVGGEEIPGEEIADYKSFKKELAQLGKLIDSALAQNNTVSPQARAGIVLSAAMTQTQAGSELTFPNSWMSAFFDSADMGGFDIYTGLPLTQAAQAANALTSIPQAGQAHPGTQMVAAQMTKMARDGTPQSMRIQLDPPELGRVDVRLHFSKDKGVKAVMVVEKPETLHLLQRDAAFLERALQDAGLKTDSASLSFQLAQDGSAFNSNNNGEGGGEQYGAGGSPDGNAEDGALIETTMTWQVDTETGHVRYDLLV